MKGKNMVIIIFIVCIVAVFLAWFSLKALEPILNEAVAIHS